MASPAPFSMLAPLRRLGRRWRGDRRGATAVEFAIIAAPFFFMIFAIIQLALHFMVQVTLDNATATAARQLRTGTVVADGSSDTSGASSFATSICNNMSWLQSQCSNNLTVDVRPLTSYSSTPTSPTFSSTGTASKTCYYSGSAGTAVELRAYYKWQMFATALMQSLQTYSNGVSQIQSTEVFQVEPNGQTNSSATQC